MSSDLPVTGGKRPPVLAMWLCMVIAWIILILPQGTIFIGAPLAIVALVLAILCIQRGRKVQGILGCLGATIGSVIAYVIGLTIFAGMAMVEMKEEYDKRIAAAETEVAAAKSVPAVPAEQILADFTANRNEAEKKYTQVYDVTGTVTKVGTDTFGFPYIAIAGANSGSNSIQCIFKPGSAGDLSRYTVGSEITVRGKVEWMMKVELYGSKVIER